MKYYFGHIKNGQISEGYTTIKIANYEAEIANDDPDAVLVARKNDGVPKERLKWEDRFRLPPPPRWEFFQLTDATDLERLSKSDIGEGYFAIEMPLDIDTLSDVVFDHLPRGPRGYLFVEQVDWPPRTFRLSCARWGFLGELQFSRRGNNATILRLHYVPRPAANELSTAKMLGEFDLFQYGKQKHRGEVIRWLFDSLRYDPIWLSREEETIHRILAEIKQIRDDQIKIVNIIQSLRRWAKIVQQEGLPSDKKSRIAIESLSQSIEDLGGTTQYLEANLPLIPGILNYKVELGSEHRIQLRELLNEFIGEFGKNNRDNR